MKLRLVGAAVLLTLLTACGSGGGGETRPTIGATLPPAGGTLPPGETAPPGATAPPETAPPETAPPETAPPETAPPETAPPETAPPDTAAPETAAPETIAPDEGTDGGTVWWPWVLGALVLIGLIAWLVTRRKSKAAAPWQVRATTVLDDVDQLTSHLPALTPEGLISVAPTDARTLAALRATVQDLMAIAPDVGAQASLSKLVAPLGELHGAVDSVALSGQAVLPGGLTVAQLASQLHTASASVRADLALRR